jgi:hypothetical protein
MKREDKGKRREAAMECPHLETARKASICRASITLMDPGSDERASYCATGEYWRCPVFLSHWLRGGSRLLRA